MAAVNLPPAPVFLTLASALLFAPAVIAQPVRIGSSPSRPGKAGFSMTVHTEPVGGNGYQPLYLDFQAVGKQFIRDRYLQVEIGPRHSYDSELDFDFRYSVKLPQGRPSVRFPIYVPHYYAWDQMSVRIIEDGREIESSRVGLGFGGIRTRFANQRATVGIMLPADRDGQDAEWKMCPDVRTLVTVLGEGPIPEQYPGITRLSHVRAMQLANRIQPAWVQFRFVYEESLHENWLGYSQLDIIIVARPLLSRIARQSPSQCAAITDWLAAGGTLWVYAAPDLAGTSLASIDLKPPSANRMLRPKNVRQLLSLSQVNDTSELTYESYNGIQKRSQNYSFRAQQSGDVSMRSAIFNKLDKAGHPFTKTVPAAEIAGRMRVGSFGLGRVTAIESEDPFPGSFQFWKSLAQIDNVGNRLQWSQRNGIDVPSGNDNYWMWLIESVGQPPVKSFVLLNTLFVIIIGPVCYFVFRRRERLYLLYFFAPALALLVTLSLFAYALIADGMQTQAKIRQITWLDLENDYAVDQSRETYYAVFGSGGGLEFSSQAAVYPIRNRPAVDRYYRSRDSARKGEMISTPDSQRFVGHFLPPRDQVQYMVIQPQQVAQSLSLELAAGSGKLTNHLPLNLERFLVHDTGGRLWGAENVGAGETVALDRATFDEVSELLNSRVLPQLGEVPRLQRRGRQSASPGMQISLLETKLQLWSQNLPLGSFVAIAKVSSEAVASKDAVLTGSVHVLMGELP
jgi:hypothetical protein